jgi:hypothetical protein
MLGVLDPSPPSIDTHAVCNASNMQSPPADLPHPPPAPHMEPVDSYAPLRLTRPHTRRPRPTTSRPPAKVLSPTSLALYAHTEPTQLYARSIPPPIPLRFCYAGLSRSPSTTRHRRRGGPHSSTARAPTNTAAARAAPCSHCPVARGHTRRVRGRSVGGASRPEQRGRSEHARAMTDLDRVGHRVSLGAPGAIFARLISSSSHPVPSHGRARWLPHSRSRDKHVRDDHVSYGRSPARRGGRRAGEARRDCKHTRHTWRWLNHVRLSSSLPSPSARSSPTSIHTLTRSQSYLALTCARVLMLVLARIAKLGATDACPARAQRAHTSSLSVREGEVAAGYYTGDTWRTS